jgi:hypothetical protein
MFDLRPYREREDGAAVHIGWVYRVDFYGRLGYARWQAFHMSSRNLSSG